MGSSWGSRNERSGGVSGVSNVSVIRRDLHVREWYRGGYFGATLTVQSLVVIANGVIMVVPFFGFTVKLPPHG